MSLTKLKYSKTGKEPLCYLRKRLRWGVAVYVALYDNLLPHMYSREERLTIYGRIAVTKEVYALLREQKKLQKLSLAKIVCNLIIEKYGKNKLRAD